MTRSALRHIEWDACMLEPQRDPEVELYLMREIGLVPPVARYFLPSPWVARSYAGLGISHSMLAHTDLQLAHLVGMIVSQERSCRYCYAAQRTLLRILGLSEARIRQLEGDLLAAQIDPRERAALEFATTLSRANPRPGPQHIQALRDQGFTTEASHDIAFIVVSFVYFTVLSTLPAISPDALEQYPDRLHVRLLRPLLSRKIARFFDARRIAPMPLKAGNGPFGSLTTAVSGLPWSGTVREAIEDAFSSSVLRPRTKALIFGVIARGLESEYVERESIRLASDDGLSPEDFDHAVSHLAAPALEPVEAILLPESRQTIRCRPIDIQRRARTLLERISVPEFVDFLGTAALANAVCRLALVVEPTA